MKIVDVERACAAARMSGAVQGFFVQLITIEGGQQLPGVHQVQLPALPRSFADHHGAGMRPRRQVQPSQSNAHARQVHRGRLPSHANSVAAAHLVTEAGSGALFQS